MISNALSLRNTNSVTFQEVEDKLARSARRSQWVLAALLLGVGGALTLVPISSAVIAVGELTAASRNKKIAHPRGGVIATLPISNGDRVKKGQMLVEFDTNVSSASAAMTVESIDQLLAREARLRAEREGLASIPFPPALTQRSGTAEVARAIREEQRIFSLNRQMQQSQRATITQQIRQAEQSIRGYAVQADVYRKQEELIAEEQVANDQLWEKRYTTLQRRNELNRAAVGLRGSAASADSSAAQLNARIAELRERMLLLGETARREAGTELASVQSRLIELRQNNVVAQDTNSRNTVTAPYAGVVEKLAFTTIGGVVPAGETILEIIPESDPLIVLARVSPADIDRLQVGAEVNLRFSAFNLQTTPEIKGTLKKVAADRSIDPGTGISFYPVEIALAPNEVARLGNVQLRPGMPVEAFIRTGERTLLAYLFKPLGDQIERAFR